MTDKQKLNKFLQLQSKELKIDDIAKELDSDVKSLRRFLNKNGYRSVKGKYQKKEDSSSDNTKQLELNIKSNKSSKVSKNTQKSIPSKKTKSSKININAQDLDKLCEVYDWYLSVKDIRAIQPKGNKSKKDVVIDSKNLKDLKASRIQVDKAIWEEFERLCSNSKYSKSEIITQALKEFLIQYKHLI
ncbi:hypothetical protein [Paraclostridium sordellii]|uniref:Transcriptional regulator n=1 Tax=Paraclostridium sordellii TaxID=1505 RepID=A0A0C7PAH1_PARSO|nr:hypothetical protein [Paeniclostridium sordellii]QYE96490.1 DNA-binding protein [Paeniclostridium sordellii]CEN78522.1 transcriptional regulator [[Clostridium] sordellii] [Paeniclostridium sordellii]CEO08805.1 transcriptional regulator [[Clostridium] sordellii] [Paeniclostridium sordellii]CEP87346.1 transcriptional regulator [[Clostridium] sordellii] [Paeniclostridium sordellii]CEP95688.1 transcriptional regulator [[Clostridium] sordellii] [Paeniclostridium sordellii]